jgi:tRNA modification GTPase
MLLRTDDTIVAIASAPGGALRGIVRVSGPRCLEVASQWFRASDSTALSSLLHPTAVRGVASLGDDIELPGELFVWPSTRSYTRQPTVEFHTLGSPPLLQRLVQTICRCGARLAEPGEFTLRAFLAGRLDLTQAEAVLGVIDAGSRSELDVALRQLAGGLAGPLRDLRDTLLDVLAHLEAGLDFVEEDIEFISSQQLRGQLLAAQQQVQQLIEQMATRAASSTEYRVALYGRPNAGKSSLLNALGKSQRAIVSDVAGTTRDYVTASLHCDGLPCLLIDTAGVDAAVADATIDHAAQNASRRQAEEAHLRLFCLDASRPLDDWETRELAQGDERRLVVLTKCDVPATEQLAGLTSGRASLCASRESQIRPDFGSDGALPSRNGSSQIPWEPPLVTSSRTGLGLRELERAMAAKLLSLHTSEGEVVAGTAIRCRDSLERADHSLAEAIHAVDLGVGEEFVAGEIRVALDELGRVAGAVYTDDILDRIFSRFCIGK